jgi:hypothetical protein
MSKCEGGQGSDGSTACKNIFRPRLTYCIIRVDLLRYSRVGDEEKKQEDAGSQAMDQDAIESESDEEVPTATIRGVRFASPAVTKIKHFKKGAAVSANELGD